MPTKKLDKLTWRREIKFSEMFCFSDMYTLQQNSIRVCNTDSHKMQGSLNFWTWKKKKPKACDLWNTYGQTKLPNT